MPKLTDDTLEVLTIKGTNYQYSGVRLENLGATEYTLVTIAVDTSSSVAEYKDHLEKCLKSIILACGKSPRADNLMIRFLTFNNQVQEEHGYKLLTDCNPDDYLDCLDVNGMTALFDATYNAITAASAYAADLSKNDFDVNGIIFILTDGMDNRSTFTPVNIADAIRKSAKEECLESLTPILIGVNLGSGTDQYLEDFKREAGITKYVNVGDADEKTLAKVTEFVSKSISSSSQSLRTGQAPNITF